MDDKFRITTENPLIIPLILLSWLPGLLLSGYVAGLSAFVLLIMCAKPSPHPHRSLLCFEDDWSIILPLFVCLVVVVVDLVEAVGFGCGRGGMGKRWLLGLEGGKSAAWTGLVVGFAVAAVLEGERARVDRSTVWLMPVGVGLLTVYPTLGYVLIGCREGRGDGAGEAEAEGSGIPDGAQETDALLPPEDGRMSPG